MDNLGGGRDGWVDFPHSFRPRRARAPTHGSRALRDKRFRSQREGRDRTSKDGRTSMQCRSEAGTVLPPSPAEGKRRYSQTDFFPQFFSGRL